jgi:hypothetical protein
MKILRLTNSSDLHPGVPENERSTAVSGRLIEDSTGEHVESLVKAIWPTKELPPAVDRWMDSFQPDVVFFRLSSYWVAYESVPLRVERRLGRIGKPLARAGVRVGEQPWVVQRRGFKWFRTWLLRTIGGDTHFTPKQVAEVLDEVFAKVAARESIVSVVRGTSLIVNSPGTNAGLRRSLRRVAELNALVEASCRRHRIPFVPEAPSNTVSETRLEDDLHDSAVAHRKLGEEEAEAILAAWKAAHAGAAALSPQQ